MKSLLIMAGLAVLTASAIGTHQAYAWGGWYGGYGWGCHHHWWGDPANGYGQGYALGQQQQQSNVIVINNNNNGGGYQQPDP